MFSSRFWKMHRWGVATDGGHTRGQKKWKTPKYSLNWFFSHFFSHDWLEYQIFICLTPVWSGQSGKSPYRNEGCPRRHSRSSKMAQKRPTFGPLRSHYLIHQAHIPASETHMRAFQGPYLSHWGPYPSFWCPLTSLQGQYSSICRLTGLFTIQTQNAWMPCQPLT